MKHLRSGTSLLAAMMAALGGTSAHATDPYGPPIVQTEDWSGFYSGRHLGAGFGHDDSRRAAVNGGGGGGGGGSRTASSPSAHADPGVSDASGNW